MGRDKKKRCMPPKTEFNALLEMYLSFGAREAGNGSRRALRKNTCHATPSSTTKRQKPSEEPGVPAPWGPAIKYGVEMGGFSRDSRREVGR